MEMVVPSPPRGGDEAGDTHPLEIPVVLVRLFELMPFNLKDFQRIRLVSRTWRNVSLTTWRKNVWLILQDSDEDERDCFENINYEDEKEIARISRQKYLDLLDNEQLQLVQHPFQKYSLNNWKIELRSLNQDGEQDRFWNRVGPLTTHLKLSCSNFARVADFRTVIFEATSKLQSLKLIKNVYIEERAATKEQRLDPKLPQHARIPGEQVQNNLMELEINLATYRIGDTPAVYPTIIINSLPITWMELIIHFPNIKKFGPMDLGPTTEADFVEFFESVEILRKERGPGYLAHLTDLNLEQVEYYPHALHGTLISTINRLQFSLKRLDVAVDSTVDEETFKQLLQHPLEYLQVVREHDEHTMPFRNFPFGFKMALKELDMCGLIVPNLLFLRECPNLERFIFDGREADLTQGLIDGNPTKLEKLTDLTFYFELGTEEIRKLGELIPNVRNLHVGLDDGSFRAVCEIWKEHLTINSWRVGEEAFLGKEEQSGKKYHHPNITDLKNLKQFKMYGYQQDFTDAMILDGILALPCLENVMVSPRVTYQVSPHVRSQLQSKFPECQVFTGS